MSSMGEILLVVPKKVHCWRKQRWLSSDEYFLLKEDDTWFYKLKHLYEEQQKAAKKSE